MSNIYQLKVQLEGATKPPIWRQLQVPQDISLYLLHCCIQGAMGWYNCHLHQFVIAGQYYGIPHPDYDMDMKDARRVKLDSVLKNEKAHIIYEYDFGDGWMHRITLEKKLPLDAKQTYPLLVQGKGACPPEDCGGVWGYAELKETMSNPKHEEYEEMLEWMGVEEFDPNEFDLEEHQDEMMAAYEEGIRDKGKLFEM